MARPRRNDPRKKVTITLEPAVVDALGPLQAELEAQAYGALASQDIKALYGPVRYTRSSIVEMAILMLCQYHGVPVNWPQPTAPQGSLQRKQPGDAHVAMDLTTGRTHDMDGVQAIDLTLKETLAQSASLEEELKID